MWLNKLKIRDFRCYSNLTVDLGQMPWVVLEGGNGAGKTSLMEAVYAAARGRSFRHAPFADMIRGGCDASDLLIDFESGGKHRLGVRFTRNSRESHLDRSPMKGLAEINAVLPVEYLGGASHRLVDGPPGLHRRFMDWALFHVERDFLATWRIWHRANRQRNEWLKRGDYPASESWTAAVVKSGEKLSTMRSDLVDRLASRLAAAPDTTILGRGPRLRFCQGWRGKSLLEDLEKSRERERRLGRAVVGPQYDDWALDFEDLSSGQLSRGQSKLISLFLWRELGRIMMEAGRSTLLFADDFLADLDADSVRTALAALRGSAGQIWLAVQERGDALELPGESLLFHVERGSIHRF